MSEQKARKPLQYKKNDYKPEKSEINSNSSKTSELASDSIIKGK